jgi:hypothetical protein
LASRWNDWRIRRDIVRTNAEITMTCVPRALDKRRRADVIENHSQSQESSLFMSAKIFAAPVAFASLAFLAAAICPSLSHAADPSTQLSYQAGRFEPSSVTLPANKPVELQVTNASDAAIEFESFELHRERVVQPGQTITVFIPALAPGSYPFVNDFNGAEAKGEIVSR